METNNDQDFLKCARILAVHPNLEIRARAELLLRSGAVEAARVSFREAIALCGNAAEGDHLARRSSCCS